jgi:hypothetical protein
MLTIQRSLPGLIVCGVFPKVFFHVFLLFFLGVLLTTLAVLAFFVHQSIAQTSNAEVFAGSKVATFGGDDGQATAASFSGPSGVWMDTVKQLYVSDAVNNRVRVISASKIVTTFAGLCVIYSCFLFKSDSCSDDRKWSENRPLPTQHQLLPRLHLVKDLQFVGIMTDPYLLLVHSQPEELT